jgi:putative membrane protein
MDLLIGTLWLRPYVFGFLLVFLVAGARDLGWWRTLLFAGCVAPVAWVAEFSSTRAGIPFGWYQYTGLTRDRELFVADVPLMDSLSFTFLAYAAFCLVRVVRAGRPWRPGSTAFLSGVFMMLLDVVIDPLAVRGDRWFLGRIFYYVEEGVYFGVPLSNFAGWLVVGMVGVGFYLAVAGPPPAHRPWVGLALYYAVLVFNLAVTAWIGEWFLLVIGTTLHVLVAMGISGIRAQRAAVPGVSEREVQV